MVLGERVLEGKMAVVLLSKRWQTELIFRCGSKCVQRM